MFLTMRCLFHLMPVTCIQQFETQKLKKILISIKDTIEEKLFIAKDLKIRSDTFKIRNKLKALFYNMFY